MPRYSHLATPSATKELLERYGLVSKHRLGQNFLVSDWVVGKILELAELEHNDCVLEVGPGIGTLTCALLERSGSVLALEADRTLEAALAESCTPWRDRLQLIWGDALKTLDSSLPGSPTKFVANLPYQVAATLILNCFERIPSVKRAVLMVQAEVADRISAGAKKKAYGAYTVKLALRARVTGRFEVAPSNFMPAPHVNSSVIRLERFAASDPDSGNALTEDQIKATSRVVTAAFAQRRKTLRNSLSASGYDKAAIDEACAASLIEPSCRAETLVPADFIRLSKHLELL